MSVKYDLIFINLAILFLITILSLISGNDFISNASEQSFVYNQALNGSTSELGYDITADFSLDPIIQAVIWISIIGGIGIASSITVVATGLNEAGTRWTVGLIFFVAIWLMLSTLPFPLITAGGLVMELIYFVMTVCYAVGAIWFLIEGGS